MKLRELKADKLLLTDVWEKSDIICALLSEEPLKEFELKEIILRLKSFGIVAVNNEAVKGTGMKGLYIAHSIFLDEIKAAYCDEEIFKKFEM